jgi:hypothetical protein
MSELNMNDWPEYPNVLIGFSDTSIHMGAKYKIDGEWHLFRRSFLNKDLHIESVITEFKEFMRDVEGGY